MTASIIGPPWPEPLAWLVGPGALPARPTPEERAMKAAAEKSAARLNGLTYAGVDHLAHVLCPACLAREAEFAKLKKKLRKARKQLKEVGASRMPYGDS